MEKKIKIRRVGPHTFVKVDDPERFEWDSDDLQWHCPRCKTRWNEPEYPCFECDHESPYELVKTASTSRYDHIDFVAPQSVADEAAKGLEYRQRAGGKGGLDVSQAKKEGVGSGVQRAVNLMNRDKMSPKTIRHMVNFFTRHEKNKAIDPQFKGEPWKDRGYVAWLTWGGDPGYSWARKVLRQMEKADAMEYSKSASRVVMAFLKESEIHEAANFGGLSFIPPEDKKPRTGDEVVVFKDAHIARGGEYYTKVRQIVVDKQGRICVVAEKMPGQTDIIPAFTNTKADEGIWVWAFPDPYRKKSAALRESCKSCRWFRKADPRSGFPYERIDWCDNSNWKSKGYYLENDGPNVKCPSYSQGTNMNEKSAIKTAMDSMVYRIIQAHIKSAQYPIQIKLKDMESKSEEISNVINEMMQLNKDRAKLKKDDPEVQVIADKIIALSEKHNKLQKEFSDSFDSWRDTAMEMAGQVRTAMDFSSISGLLTADKKLDDREIARVLRLAIAAEHDAAALYELMADAIENETIAKVLGDIAGEEKVHVGELTKLLAMVDSEDKGMLEKGEKEVEEFSEKKAVIKVLAAFSIEKSASKLPPNAKPVLITNLKVGMPIKVKQPETVAYETGSRADAGEGGMALDEKWIDSKITRVYEDEIEVADHIWDSSIMIDSYGLNQLYMIGTQLYADNSLVD